MSGKIAEQLDFALGQFAPLSVGVADFPPLEVDAAAIEVKLVYRAGPFRRATQDGFNAGQQFTDAQRFHDVIVCAEAKAVDAVGFFAAGGENNDRQGRPGFAGLLEDFETALARKNQVKHEQVEGGPERLAETTVAVACLQGCIAGKAQGVDDPLADGRVVFNYENGFRVHVTWSLYPRV